MQKNPNWFAIFKISVTRITHKAMLRRLRSADIDFKIKLCLKRNVNRSVWHQFTRLLGITIFVTNKMSKTAYGTLPAFHRTSKTPGKVIVLSRTLWSVGCNQYFSIEQILTAVSYSARECTKRTHSSCIHQLLWSVSIYWQEQRSMITSGVTLSACWDVTVLFAGVLLEL